MGGKVQVRVDRRAVGAIVVVDLVATAAIENQFGCSDPVDRSEEVCGINVDRAAHAVDAAARVADQHPADVQDTAAMGGQCAGVGGCRVAGKRQDAALCGFGGAGVVERSVADGERIRIGIGVNRAVVGKRRPLVLGDTARTRQAARTAERQARPAVSQAQVTAVPQADVAVFGDCAERVGVGIRNSRKVQVAVDCRAVRDAVGAGSIEHQRRAGVGVDRAGKRCPVDLNLAAISSGKQVGRAAARAGERAGNADNAAGAVGFH